MISMNYKNINDNLIPEGKYEVVIKNVDLNFSHGGVEYIDIPMVVRNDVDQHYKNKYIFYAIWKKKEPDKLDLEFDGFSSAQILKLCKVVGVPENKEFNNLDEIFEELKHKPVLVGVKHEIYNEQKIAKVSFVAESKFPECKHEFKTKEENPVITEIDEEDLPF